MKESSKRFSVHARVGTAKGPASDVAKVVVVARSDVARSASALASAPHRCVGLHAPLSRRGAACRHGVKRE